MRTGSHIVAPVGRPADDLLAELSRRRKRQAGAPPSGDLQVVARALAPHIHGRQMTPGTDDWPSNDQPLAMVAEIERRRDGSARIDYFVLFSNEDGGTSTTRLLARWGRTTDYERLYSVEVDRLGRIVDGGEQYQSAGHIWRGFSGLRDAGRAVLHVNTNNNMVGPGAGGSARQVDVNAMLIVERSPGAVPIDSLEVMRRIPSSWRAMAQEVRREGKVTSGLAINAAGDRMSDPRRYAYVAGAPSAGTQLRVVLRNGRQLDMTVPRRRAIPDGRSIAVLLPGGVRGADVAAITATQAGLRHDLLQFVTVLDDSDSPREFQPRTDAVPEQ